MIIESLPARSKKSVSQNIEEVYKKYNKMIYQVSFAYMKNKMETEDIVEDTFVKLIKAE